MSARRGVSHGLADAYAAATIIGARHAALRLMAVGIADASDVPPSTDRLHVTVVAAPSVIAGIDSAARGIITAAWDTASDGPVSFSAPKLTETVIVAELRSGVDPGPLLVSLAAAQRYAPAIIIVGAELGDTPASADQCHGAPVDLFRELCRAAGLEPTFCGLQGSGPARRPIAIVDSTFSPMLEPAPDWFTVVAIMTSYNEADVIRPTIARLWEQGVGTYLIDNWSSDDTYEIAASMAGHGLVGIERFPEQRPTTYDWTQLLQRKEALADELGATWYIHHDADEVRRSPWAGVTIRDALWAVDRAGFTTIDHTVANHYPIDDSFTSGADLPTALPCFEWGMTEGDELRVNGWKSLGRAVVLHGIGGHWIQFAGAHVFPYNFLLEHYPVRSQAHGVRKVLGDRKPRWNAAERAKGWHVQYDTISEGHDFLRAPRTLMERDELALDRHDLLTRLLRVGDEEANAVALLGAGRCPGARLEVGVSAVLLARDPDRVLPALDAVRRATAMLAEADIVVIANGAAAVTPDIVREAGKDVRWIRFDRPISAPVAWRRGIAAARGSHVLAVSDDVALSPDCLADLLDATATSPETLVATHDGVEKGSALPGSDRGVLRFGLASAFQPGAPSRLIGVPGVIAADDRVPAAGPA